MEEKKSVSSSRKNLLIYMKQLENKLNGEIGFNWWKRYISAALWDNMGTPINLIITLLTAITTAQANTNNFISDQANSRITVAALIMSTINTFFRPHVKVNINVEIMNKYTEFGNKFEEIYYIIPNIEDKITSYKTLLMEINNYENNQGTESINFFSDFIHIISRYLCLKRREKWLDFDKELAPEMEEVL